MQGNKFTMGHTIHSKVHTILLARRESRKLDLTVLSVIAAILIIELYSFNLFPCFTSFLAIYTYGGSPSSFKCVVAWCLGGAVQTDLPVL